MARALEANGAKVFILDINPAKLEEASKQSVSFRFSNRFCPFLYTAVADIKMHMHRNLGICSRFSAISRPRRAFSRRQK